MDSNKQNRLVIIVILAIGIFIILGLIFYQISSSKGDFFEYNGFTIYEGDNNGLKTYKIEFFINNNPQPFLINNRYDPRELEDIPVYPDIKRDLIENKQELYVTMEPNLSGKATIAFAEINKYIENPFLFNLPTFPSLLSKSEGNNLPLITCGNANPLVGVIMFKIGVKNEVYEENGCVILEAINEDELIRVASRLTLTVLGIMD